MSQFEKIKKFIKKHKKTIALFGLGLSLGISGALAYFSKSEKAKI